MGLRHVFLRICRTSPSALKKGREIRIPVTIFIPQADTVKQLSLNIGRLLAERIFPVHRVSDVKRNEPLLAQILYKTVVYMRIQYYKGIYGGKTLAVQDVHKGLINKGETFASPLYVKFKPGVCRCFITFVFFTQPFHLQDKVNETRRFVVIYHGI